MLVVAAVCLTCVVLLQGAAAGKSRIVLPLLVVLAAMYVPVLTAGRDRVWLAGLPLLVFWIPAPFMLFDYAPLRALSLVEVLVALALFLIAVGALARQRSGDFVRAGVLPWGGFLLLFAGTAVTYVFNSHTGTELPVLRVIFLLPFALGLLTLAAVERVEDARRLLWLLLASASVLAVVFLLGSRGLGSLGPSNYATGTGRASLAIDLPFFGGLIINPQSAGDKFALAFMIAWFLTLTATSLAQRVAAAAAALLFAGVVITAQGRAGLIACVLAVTVFGIWGMRRPAHERLVAQAATLVGLVTIVGSSAYLALASNNPVLAARFVRLLTDPGGDYNFVQRTHLWRQGFDLAVSHPLGLGLFSPPYSATSTWMTHNLWLFVALTCGWLGVAGLAWILVRLGRVFVGGFQSANADGRRLSILGLVLLIGVLVTGMSSPLVWEPYSAVLVWAPLWIAFAGVVRGGATIR